MGYNRQKKTEGSSYVLFSKFVDMEGRKCLIVGGGKVAWRKVKVLQEFGADLKVVAPEIIKDIFEMDEIKCCKRPFEEEDLKSVDFVVAATTDISLNHEISQKCRSLKIPVNAVDQVADCDFIFPSYMKTGRGYRCIYQRRAKPGHYQISERTGKIICDRIYRRNGTVPWRYS